MDKEAFIELIRSEFEEALDRPVKKLNETKFATLKYRDVDTDDEPREIEIKGYKFEPYPEPDEYMYAVKFKVSINGESSNLYSIHEFYDEEIDEDREFGLSDNIDDDDPILEKIYFLLSLLE